MIDCKKFYKKLKKSGIGFFTGVPDSLLKDICACISENASPTRHVIAANEGNAVALAAGYHLATGKTAMLYMQNSGQGNALNPLASLAARSVYSIPMLIMIGWRGKPGVKDEPQHGKQGAITTEFFKMLGIPFEILPDSTTGAFTVINRAINHMARHKSPYAVIIPKGVFGPYAAKSESMNKYKLLKEDAIKFLAEQINGGDAIISTTGKISRELFECRESGGQNHRSDFLNIGAMGHASSIALGLALCKPRRAVYCFDGDGSFIMHMGSVAVIGSESPANFKHVIFNNGAHDSVGGQPTAGFKADLRAVAKACGYKLALRVCTMDQLKKTAGKFIRSKGPALLEIMVSKGSRPALGRPTVPPGKSKAIFMDFLKKETR